MRWRGDPNLKKTFPVMSRAVDKGPPTAAAATGAAGPAAAGVLPSGKMSDEEIAWRLHQELNAASPMLRTRSRKPNSAGSSGGAGSGEDAPAAVIAAATRRGGAKGAGQSATRHASSHPDDASAATEQPQRRQRDEGGRTAAQSDVPSKAEGRAERPRAGENSAVKKEYADTAHAADGAVSSPPKAATIRQAATRGTEPANAVSNSPSDAGAVPARVSRHQQQQPDSAVDREKGRKERNKGEESKGGKAEDGDAPKAAPHRSRKNTRPEAATEAGAAPLPPVLPVQPPAAAKLPRPPRTLKIPKLPMVRHNKKWYRARLLKDSGEKVLLEFAGFEHVLPSCWLPRESDRLWLGSYKGKDWRYLGEGAWEPKAGINNRSAASIMARGRRGGMGSKQARPAEDDEEQAGSESEEEEEEEDGGDAEMAEEEGGDCVGPGRAAPRARDRKRSASEASANGDEERAGGSKKARREGGRGRRLDPIVREALRAAERGHGGEEEEPEVQGRGSGQHLAGGSAFVHRRAQPAGAAGVDPTPTPETPSTRLSSHRQSGTPGALGGAQPLSPRAAAAAGGGGGGAKERAGRQRGRGRPAGSAHANATQPAALAGGRRHTSSRGGSESEGGQGGHSEGGGGGNESSDEDVRGGSKRHRPRRAARKAAIYYDAEFALEGDVDAEPEHPGWYYVPAAPESAAQPEEHLDAHDAAAAGAPVRRRRKPLVASPAPTDVGMRSVDEFEALAALAEMPSSPRAPHDVPLAQRGGPSVDAATAPLAAAALRSSGGGAMQAPVTEKRRGRPPGSTNNSNRHHHHHHQLSQVLHHPRQTAARLRNQQQLLGGRPYHGGGGALGLRMSHSTALERHAALRRCDVQRGGPNGGGMGMRARRACSLDSLATAQHMFGRLLGAIASTLGGGGGSPAECCSADLLGQGGLGQSFERSASLGGGYGKAVHLFGHGWTQHRWVNADSGDGSADAGNGGPAILSVPADLFRSALTKSDSNGEGGAVSEAAAAALAAPVGQAAKPPVPLFC